MINRKAQRGASYWSIMFGVMLVVIIGKAIIITWPAYWDNRLINASIEERLKTSTDNSPEKFVSELQQQFTLNNLRDLDPKDIMKVSNSGGELVVQTDYEVRKKFIANIDLIMSFEKQFDQRAVKASGK